LVTVYVEGARVSKRKVWSSEIQGKFTYVCLYHIRFQIFSEDKKKEKKKLQSYLPSASGT